MKFMYAKLYPDGSGSVTRKNEKPLEQAQTSCPWSYRSSARRAAMASLGAIELARVLGVELGVQRADPLTLSNAAKVRIPAKRATRQLSQRGRRTLKRSCAVFESATRRQRTAFITLTLSNGVLARILAQSAERDAVYQRALSEFNDRFRKLLKARGLPGDTIWVSEIHPGRSKRAGLSIPHVHLIAQTALRDYRWLVSTCEIRSLWMRALATALGCHPRELEPCRLETKTVKKSVARYLSKYLSKASGTNVSPRGEDDSGIIPRRWYAVANSIHKKVRDSTFVLTGDAAARILDWVKSTSSELLLREGDVTIPDGTGHDVWVATWFQLREPATPELVIQITSCL